jgi:hypothetical protein
VRGLGRLPAEGLEVELQGFGELASCIFRETLGRGRTFGFLVTWRIQGNLTDAGMAKTVVGMAGPWKTTPPERGACDGSWRTGGSLVCG